uniref:N-acetyltransferase domain-containing protein n=1 Tax=Ascaris lumbricoides TaxID=6252 RepID=A0A0M3IQQ9_ASCLU
MVNMQQLEPFKEVLRRQVPRELGKPIPMKIYEIQHPKNSGDPWMGAYSKHGFWYKFYQGNSDDFDKIVAHSYETDGYCMNYESFTVWKSAFGDLFDFIVAKNLKEDVLGSIAFACYDDIAIIGVYYIIEDYRHSGIGSKLFTEALKRLSGRKNIIFHSCKRLIYFQVFTWRNEYLK